MEKLKAGKFFSTKIPIIKIVNPKPKITNNVNCLEKPKFSN